MQWLPRRSVDDAARDLGHSGAGERAVGTERERQGRVAIVNGDGDLIGGVLHGIRCEGVGVAAIDDEGDGMEFETEDAGSGVDPGDARAGRRGMGGVHALLLGFLAAEETGHHGNRAVVGGGGGRRRETPDLLGPIQVSGMRKQRRNCGGMGENSILFATSKLARFLLCRVVQNHRQANTSLRKALLDNSHRGILVRIA
jgi:hypothetical protein